MLLYLRKTNTRQDRDESVFYPVIFGSLISIIILPYDIDAQRPNKQTLHSQTLDTIIKQTNLFKGNSQINVGASTSSLDINLDTNTVYVANSGSAGISVIDGVPNKVVARVTFNINPADSGHIICNKID